MDWHLGSHEQHLTYESFAAQAEVIAIQQMLAVFTQGFVGGTEADVVVVRERICLGKINAASHVIGSNTIPAVLLDVLVLDDDDPVTRVVIVCETNNLLMAVGKALVFDNEQVRHGCTDIIAKTLGNLERGAVGVDACTCFQELNVLMSFNSVKSLIHN